MKLNELAPIAAAALALAGAAVGVVPPSPVDGFDVDTFSRVPVLEGGRVKPIDSVARNSLLMIRGQQSFRHGDRTVTADEWMLDMLFRPEVADQQKVFVINDPEVLGLLGVKQTSERYFPFATLAPHLTEIEKQGLAAQAVEAKQRTRFQGAIVNLYERLFLYFKLKNTVQLEGMAPLAAEVAGAGDAAAAQRQDALAQLAAFRIVPPAPGA
ncbi:MAG TPA: cytochrome C assembly protein, partial [Anaeromyxobacteraceae bacterium]|nr:cytochrome C assembly protein [Anaeromyxobacteraceae bacterium]